MAGKDGALAGSAAAIAKLKALGALGDGKVIFGALAAGMKEAQKLVESRIAVGTRYHRTYKKHLVGPGYAKAHIELFLTMRTDNGLPAALLGVTKEAYYAVQFVERGTSKMAAHPAFIPSFLDSKDAQERAIVAYLNGAIVRVATSVTA